MSQYITGIFIGIRFTDIIDILIITLLIYKAWGYLKTSRAAQLTKGIGIIIAIALIAEVCNLYVVSWLIGKILSIGLIALVVVFQPELRRVLGYIGRGKFNIRSQESLSAEYKMSIVDAIVKSVEYFSARKEGAIMVFEQDVALDDIAETGTNLDTKISTEAINNIFYKGAPLHDGAVIIRDDRIYAAGCVLPLTQNQNLSRDLGTRHRAGLGISEVSDALVLIVSEETGIISIARNGRLSRFLDLKSVEKQLLAIYMDGGREESILTRFAKLWRKSDENQEQ